MEVLNRRIPNSKALYHLITFLFLLLPSVVLIPELAEFPYPPSNARYSDLSLAHYPNAVYLRRSIIEEHRLPLWSPSILSGAPFAANPLSGMWYPPGWLALVFFFFLGFNLTILLHLVWGGIGMYCLLRSEGLSRYASLLGALSFEAMPKIFAHYGAGHLTLLYALPWTPWLLWASRSRVIVFGRRFLYAEAVILALTFLADVRWSVYAATLWLAFSFLREFPPTLLKARCLHVIREAFLGSLLTAPLALPLIEFTRLSSRASLKPDEVLIFSLPADRLLGLIFPDFGGFHEYMLYMGQSVFLLSALALAWKTTRNRAGFWMWIAGLSLLVALGSHTPLGNPLAHLPFTNLLRVPSRALFVAGISLSAMAAHTVDLLLPSRTSQTMIHTFDLSSSERKSSKLVLTALVSFTLVLSAGVWIISGRLPVNFAWGTAFALIGSIWICLKLENRIHDRVWFTVLLGLCLLDWGVVDRSMFTSRSPESVLSESDALANYLASIPGEFRIYSPSYSLPQQTAVIHRLQLADGVDPLQLQSYVEFMQPASGVPRTGYSVTVPSFASGDPPTDNAAYRPDPTRLGWLNVRYVAADFDLPVEDLNFLAQFGGTRLYENRKEYPRAWVQLSDNAPGEEYQPAEIARWNPDRIEVNAPGPGWLVLSEIDYPGWQVWVDGKRAQGRQVAGLFRGVQLEPGAHRVVFSFHPASVFVGLAVGLFTLFLVGMLSFRRIDAG